MSPVLKVVLVFLLGLFLFFLSGVAVMVLYLLTRSPEAWLAGTVQRLSLLAVTLLVLPAFGWRKWRDFGFTSLRGIFRWRMVFWGVILGVAAAVGSRIIVVLGPPFLPETTSLTQVFLFWVSSGLGEEVFARGLIYGALLSFSRVKLRLFGIPLSLAVILSALFSAGIGMGLVPGRSGPADAVSAFAAAFVLGLVAGEYRERTGNLLPAVVVHISAGLAFAATQFTARFFF